MKADLATGVRRARAVAPRRSPRSRRSRERARRSRAARADRRRAPQDRQARSRARVVRARAPRLAPDSSLPGYAAAQALFDAGRLAEAIRAYTRLQKFTDRRSPAAEQALGVIAYRAEPRRRCRVVPAARDARACRAALPTWRALIAAELHAQRRAPRARQARAARSRLADDAALHYLAGVAHAMQGDDATAHATSSRAALAAAPELPAARSRARRRSTPAAALTLDV